jgi:hypothetical protein
MDQMMEADIQVVDLVAALADQEGGSYEDVMQQLHELSLGEDGGRHGTILVECGNGPEEMSVGRALASLSLLYPYHVAQVQPPADRFVREIINAKYLEVHLDVTIKALYRVLDPDTLNMAVAAAVNYVQDLAIAVVGRVGTSISIKGLFEAGERDPEIRKLLRWQAPVGELGDIEKAADAATEELNTRLKALPGELGRLLRSGSAVNIGQMRQAFVSIGVKPGLMDGQLMPEPIDTSFLRGMRGVEDFYICAIGARKALTTNYKQVKTSGYLSRKLVLLVANHFIDPDLEDCETLHGVQTKVLSLDHAARLEGRYIATHANQQWHLAEEGELEGLVEQDIALRSPITCAGKNGVCHHCYGALARSNASIHAGIYGVLIISEQILQRLLSSKHLLKARPTKINWPEDFLKHFSVERTSVIAESTVFRVYVKQDDIELDEDEDRRSTTIFYYKIAGKQSRIKITTPVPIYLDDEAWENTEVDDGELTLSPLQDSSVFQVPISNTDLSEALHSIFNLIEREEIATYHDAYARLMALLTKSELRTPSVHAEMILRAQVRSATDHMNRPDFSTGPDEPPYAVLKLTPAILSSPSVTNSLAFERVKAQLTSTDILRKTQPGVIDSLFGG